jgi:hypothetical protein
VTAISPLTLRKKGNEVSIYKGRDKSRKADFFTTIYHLGGVRKRTTRRNFSDARKLADEVLEKMAQVEFLFRLAMTTGNC